jgi:hypothetical protein
MKITDTVKATFPMKTPPKQILFKTVRSDGSSLHAPKGLGRKYEIGKGYRCRPGAHFAEWGPKALQALGISEIYYQRPESSAGNRVLICLGHATHESVPIFPFWDWSYGHDKTFNKKDVLAGPLETRLVSTSFTVIGEIFVPSDARLNESKKRNQKVV